MAGGQLTSVLAHLRRIVTGTPAAERSDAELLGRFLDRRDADAFAQLVERHGPLVWNVCVRVLQHDHDAEDAFQATFLILARKARSIRKQPSLASWLYGVAYRTATRARQRRKNERERVMNYATNPTPNPLPDPGRGQGERSADWQDLRPILDEEVNQLPEKYRTPVVLCYFEGQTNDEAARTLGWPKGTVAGRLARARDLLRERLTRRGLAFSSAALGTLIAANAASAAMPGAFLSTIPPAALTFAAGKAAGASSAAVIAEGVMHAMFITKLRIAAVLCLGAILLILGGGTIAYRAFGGDGTGVPTYVNGNGLALANGNGDKSVAKPKTDAEQLLGTWILISGGDDPELKGKPVRTFDKIIFTKDLFQFCFDDLKHDYKWSIDAKKSPKELDIIEKEPTPGKAKQKPTPCIYKLDGDRLEIAMGDPGLRPNDFAKAGKFGQHFVLKREGAASDKPKPDQELLLGNWTVVKRGEKQGWGRLTFTPDRILLHYDTIRFSCRYALDSTKSPRAVDIHGAENGTGVNPVDPYQCIYQLDGDDLQIGFGTPSQRPKDFAAAEQAGQLVVLKRDPPANEAQKEDQELLQGAWIWRQVDDNTKIVTEQKLVFNGDKYTFIKNGKAFGPYGFRVDASKSPREIDDVLDPQPAGVNVFHPRDALYSSIYDVTPDTLKIGQTEDRQSRPKDWNTAVVFTYQRQKPPLKADDDRVRIQGTWVRVPQGEKVIEAPVAGGRITQPAQNARQLFNKITFAKDHLTFVFPHTAEEYSFTLDPSKSPKELDFTRIREGPNAGQPNPANHSLYELDGDTLRICMPLSGTPRPEGMKSNRATLYVLQREKAAEKPKTDEELIQGTWKRTVVSEVSGKVLDEETWIVKEDRVYRIDFQGNETGPNKLRLDPLTQPFKRLRIVGDRVADDLKLPSDVAGGIEVRGYYALEGDTLRFAVTRPGWAGANPKGKFPDGGETGWIVRSFKRHQPGDASAVPTVLPLKHTDATRVAEIMQGLFKGPEAAKIVADPQTNSLIISGTAKQLDEIKQVLDKIDSLAAKPDAAKADDKKFVDRVADPRLTLDLVLGQVRHLVLKKEPKRIQLGSETFAKFTLVDPKTLGLQGQAVGQTTLTLWFTGDDGKDEMVGYLVTVRNADTPAAAGPLTQRARDIVKEMIETAKTAYDLRKEHFLAGRGGSEDLLATSRRIVEAHALDPARRQDFLTALEAHVQRMKEAEDVTKKRFEAGHMTAQEVAATKYARLEAELWLEREKAKPKGQEQGRIEIQRMRVELAEAALAAKKDRVPWAEAMVKRGFLTQSGLTDAKNEVKSAEIAVAEAKLELERLMKEETPREERK